MFGRALAAISVCGHLTQLEGRFEGSSCKTNNNPSIDNKKTAIVALGLWPSSQEGSY